MSILTSSILASVDYKSIQAIRIHNLATLHQILAPYNEFPVFRAAPAMSYPFLWKGLGLREILIQNKIYVPVLWHETLQNKNASLWEKYLSEHLCALPVDQRYDDSDMEYIGKTILKLLKSI